MNYSIGQRIKSLRKSAIKTQQDLADACNCSIDTIKNYEKDLYSPSSHTLIKMALYFDVSADYILCLTELSDVPSNQFMILRLRYQELLRNKPEEGENYYWIYYEEQKDGKSLLKYQTEWAGFTDEKPQRELRRPRFLIPENAIKVCTDLYGPTAVINQDDEFLIFQLIGGHAIIKVNIFEVFFPGLSEPFIMEA